MSRSYPLMLLALAAAGAFVVVATFAFGSGAAEGIAFGVSIGTLITGVAAGLHAPDRAGRVLSGSVVLVSAWTILVALGIFSGATQEWLIFAGGAAVAAAGLIGSALLSVARAPAQLVSVPQAA